MEFSSQLISDEYQRVCAQLGVEDPYQSATTIGIHDVLRAHFLIADYFAADQKLEGVAGIGPKDLNLLHSALYRQHIGFGGAQKFGDPLETVGTLMYGLIKDHPFYDANKRTALMSALFHLEKLNRVPDAPQRDFESLTVNIAGDALEEYPSFKKFKKKNREPEVSFIADYLRRRSRAVDRRHYDVTYAQLNTILARYDCALENPRNNAIDVVKYESRRALLGLGATKRIGRRICHIGFPGWKSQVQKSTVSLVREQLGLTAERGFDSRIFYQNADPIPSLISRYDSVLRRLADR